MATYYASGSDWHTASHWGLTSGASDGAVPTINDDVIFDTNSVAMSMSADGSCKSIDFQAAFASTFDRAGFNLTVGTGGMTGTGGTFVGAAGNLTIGTTSSGDLTLNGMAFTAPSGTLDIYGLFISAGSFAHNGGQVIKRRRNMTLSIVTTFNKFESDSAGSNVVWGWGANQFIVETEFKMTNNHGLSVGTSDPMHLKGNYIANDNYAPTGGTFIVEYNGTGAQSITLGNPATDEIPRIRLNKASGTLTLNTDIRMRDGYTHVAGTLDQNGKKITFISNPTIVSGPSQLWGDVEWNAAGNTNINTNDMVITGNMTIVTTNTFQGNAQIKFRGAVLESQRATAVSAPNRVIEIDGTGAQTWRGDSAGAYRYFPGIHINKASGVLTIENRPAVQVSFEYTKGTVVATGSRVLFSGISTRTINAVGLVMDTVERSVGNEVNTGTFVVNNFITAGGANIAGGITEILKSFESNDTSMTGTAQKSFRGELFGTLLAVASNDMPDGQAVFNNRRGRAKLLSNFRTGTTAPVLLKEGSLIDLNGFTLTIQGDFTHNGNIDKRGGTLVVNGTYTRNGFIGDMQENRLRNVRNRIRQENVFRSKRAIA